MCLFRHRATPPLLHLPAYCLPLPPLCPPQIYRARETLEAEWPEKFQDVLDRTQKEAEAQLKKAAEAKGPEPKDK
jgi:hypothetical protein